MAQNKTEHKQTFPKIVVDAEDAVLGRLASFAAKQSLQGNEIIIVNSEKAIISGNRTDIITKYKVLKAKGGHAMKGPNPSRIPYKIIKKAIRGMLPDYRWGEGRDAFKRIMCYEGIPAEFSKEKMTKIQGNKPVKFITIKELSQNF